MGKALAGTYPAARRVFEEADEALGFAISRLCFEGPEDQLKLTENTQPALLTVSIAAFEVLRAEGMAPDYVAGHSLGEYSALVAAGSLRFADAVRLVRKRGQYMQAAVPPGVGAMAAILKLPEGKLDAVLAAAAQGEVVSAANLNSPDQVVIAGHAGAVNRAAELAKAAGARRAVLLPVSAPFHCALMAPAQERLRADLDATEFRDLGLPAGQQLAGPRNPLRRRGPRGCLSTGAEPGALVGDHPLSGGAGCGALRGSRRGRRANRVAAQHRSGAERCQVRRARGLGKSTFGIVPSISTDSVNLTKGQATLGTHDKFRCPSCGGADIRHSLPRGLWDSFLMAFGKTPFRCRRCERRFYRHTATPALAEPEARTETARADTEESVRGTHP